MMPTGEGAVVVDEEVVGRCVVDVEGVLEHSAKEGKFEPELPVQSLSTEFNILHEDVVSSDSKTQ